MRMVTGLLQRYWILFAIAAIGSGCETLNPCKITGGESKVCSKSKLMEKKIYEATWESLKNYEVPEWYKDAKFGIFIHWGPYCVPAYGHEWYPSEMYRKGHDVYEHHKESWGDQKEFGYNDFIPKFGAEKFDAEEWAALFQKAGAKYVVPVACHHDGFAMYDSAYTKWDAADKGPRRDIVGELAWACRRKGMEVGLSTHYAMNWDYYVHSDEFDTSDAAYAGLYNDPHPMGQPPSRKFLEHWYERTLDIVDKYQPVILWFDFGFFRPAFEPYRRKLTAYYYNKGLEWEKGVVLNYKDNVYPYGTAVLDLERSRLNEVYPMVWQTDTSISMDSWGYIKDDSFKPTSTLIHDLVDIVSKNGVLLLNFGPPADGIIPKPVRERLLAMGEWLKVNGEAIYGARPWLIYGEGAEHVGTDFGEGEESSYSAEDIRFTAKGHILYATCLGEPEKDLKIRALGKSAQPYLWIEDINLLGSDEKITWRQENEHLVINPSKKQAGKYALVFRIAPKGIAIEGLRTKSIERTVNAQVMIINYGDGKSSNKLSLDINGRAVQSQMVNTQPGTMKLVKFSYTAKEPGFYKVAIGGTGFSTAGKEVALPVIKLGGQWLFKAGDSVEWKEAEFDDSDWRRVEVPMMSCEYSQEIDYHWLRRKVFIPKAFKGYGLVLTVGKIDGASETYFNGKLIGRMSRIPFGDEQPMYEDTQRHLVRSELIQYGSDNVIAVRIYGLKDCVMYADMAPIEYRKRQYQEEN